MKDKDKEGDHIVLETEKMTIKDDYTSIIDYSKPSTEPRLYLINLNTGGVEKFLVAHGQNSGSAVASAFSNIDDSKKSSLGLYIAGDVYYGHHGRSLHLHGIEASNSNAMLRDIVIHSADYVSYDFIKSRGRLGRSWGCPAVSPGVIEHVINTMKNGSVIYGFHKDLMTSTLKNPDLQTLAVKPQDDSTDKALPGEEGTATTTPAAVVKSATTPATSITTPLKVAAPVAGAAAKLDAAVAKPAVAAPAKPAVLDMTKPAVLDTTKPAAVVPAKVATPVAAAKPAVAAVKIAPAVAAKPAIAVVKPAAPVVVKK